MRLRIAHASLQFSDTDKHHTADVESIFSRAVDRRYAWITGTETGPGAGNTGKELLRVGKDADYKLWVPSEQAKAEGRATDCWVAVRADLVKKGWKTGFIPAIPGSAELYKDLKPVPKFPRWGPKGLVTVEFDSLPQLGHLSIMSAHHLTKGQVDGPVSVIHGVDHHEWNQKMDAEITKWARTQAKGSNLAFGAMDRNLSDRRNEGIPGTTTLADELEDWQSTGHGDIDWIFTTNKDGRVTAVSFTPLDDRQFPLFTDHFFVEGVVRVDPVPTKK